MLSTKTESGAVDRSTRPIPLSVLSSTGSRIPPRSIIGPSNHGDDEGIYLNAHEREYENPGDSNYDSAASSTLNLSPSHSGKNPSTSHKIRRGAATPPSSVPSQPDV